MFLSARYVRLDFLVVGAKLIELAAATVEIEAVYVLNANSCSPRLFFGQVISPRIVGPLVLGVHYINGSRMC